MSVTLDDVAVVIAQSVFDCGGFPDHNNKTDVLAKHTVFGLSEDFTRRFNLTLDNGQSFDIVIEQRII